MRIDPANPGPPANVVRRVGRDQIPDHVPPGLIHSSGLIFGPDFLAAPHKFMAEMHEKFPPLYYDVGPFGSAGRCSRTRMRCSCCAMPSPRGSLLVRHLVGV